MDKSENKSGSTTNIGDRIRSFFESEGLTRAEFAERLKIGYDKLSSYVTNKAEPGAGFWILLKTEFPEADLTWFLTGFRSGESSKRGQREIPILDHIPAGPLNRGFGEVEALGFVRTMVDDPEAFGLIVRGNSMWPDIQEGDEVILSPNSPFVNGRIYAVVTTDSEHSLKRVRKDSRTGSYVLMPSNPEFPKVYVPQEQILKLLRVVEIRRSM